MRTGTSQARSQKPKTKSKGERFISREFLLEACGRSPPALPPFACIHPVLERPFRRAAADRRRSTSTRTGTPGLREVRLSASMPDRDPNERIGFPRGWRQSQFRIGVIDSRDVEE